MKMILNKKGAAPIIVVAIILLIIGLVLVIKPTSAGTLPSYYTETPSGCKPTNIGVTIKGTVVVEDTTFWGVEPSIMRVDVDSVTFGTSRYLGVFSQQYDWKVEAIDPFSGNQIAVDRGQDTHPGGAVKQEEEYILSFFMPDNNCDGKVDDFDLILEASITASLVGDVPTDKKRLEFRNGRFIR